MASAKNRFLADAIGTLRSYWRVGTIRLKDVAGVLQIRNAGDTADAGLKSSGLNLSGLSDSAGDIAEFDGSGNISAVAPPGIVYGNGQQWTPSAFHAVTGGFGPANFLATVWLNTYWSMASLNSEANVKFLCEAGNYAVKMLMTKGAGNGDPTLLIDGVSYGALSGYNATNLNVELSWVVNSLSAGLHTLTIKTATKQPASSGYLLVVSLVTIAPNP